MRYPGQYYDTESSVSNNLFRDYYPAWGRYTESDPVGLDAGINTYSYVDSNPLNFVDPEGLSEIKIIKLCIKGYKVIRNASFRDAVTAARNGEDVLATSHSEAKQIARAASKGKRLLSDPAHKPEKGQMPHYHPNPKTGSHVFYSIAAAMTFSHYVNCHDCVEEKLADVGDFFNPLSAPQDMIDLYDELQQ